MEREDYRPRLIDNIIDSYLEAFGAVCVEGPKWCGKTWTSSYHCKSEIMLGNPDGNFQNRQLAQMSPSLVLEGETPRLIYIHFLLHHYNSTRLIFQLQSDRFLISNPIVFAFSIR